MIKIKLAQNDLILFLNSLSSVKINTIEDFRNILIYYYIKDNRAKFYKKLLDNVEKPKDEIKISFTIPQASAIVSFLKFKNEYPFPYIVGELHKQIIDSLPVNYDDKKLFKI